MEFLVLRVPVLIGVLRRAPLLKGSYKGSYKESYKGSTRVQSLGFWVWGLRVQG